MVIFNRREIGYVKLILLFITMLSTFLLFLGVIISEIILIVGNTVYLTLKIGNKISPEKIPLKYTDNIVSIIVETYKGIGFVELFTAYIILTLSGYLLYKGLHVIEKKLNKQEKIINGKDHI